MAIPASYIVAINPRLINAGGTDLEFNGLLLSKNPLIPLSSSVMVFASADTVGDYFGIESDEYKAAASCLVCQAVACMAAPAVGVAKQQAATWQLVDGRVGCERYGIGRAVVGHDKLIPQTCGALQTGTLALDGFRKRVAVVVVGRDEHRQLYFGSFHATKLRNNSDTTIRYNIKNVCTSPILLPPGFISASAHSQKH